MQYVLRAVRHTYTCTHTRTHTLSPPRARAHTHTRQTGFPAPAGILCATARLDAQHTCPALLPTISHHHHTRNHPLPLPYRTCITPRHATARQGRAGHSETCACVTAPRLASRAIRNQGRPDADGKKLRPSCRAGIISLRHLQVHRYRPWTRLCSWPGWTSALLRLIAVPRVHAFALPVGRCKRYLLARDSDPPIASGQCHSGETGQGDEGEGKRKK